MESKLDMIGEYGMINGVYKDEDEEDRVLSCKGWMSRHQGFTHQKKEWEI